MIHRQFECVSTQHVPSKMFAVVQVTVNLLSSSALAVSHRQPNMCTVPSEFSPSIIVDIISGTGLLHQWHDLTIVFWVTVSLMNLKFFPFDARES